MTLLEGLDQRDDIVSSTRLDRTNGAPTTFRVEMPMAPSGRHGYWKTSRLARIAREIYHTSSGEGSHKAGA